MGSTPTHVHMNNLMFIKKSHKTRGLDKWHNVQKQKDWQNLNHALSAYQWQFETMCVAHDEWGFQNGHRRTNLLDFHYEIMRSAA